MMLARTTTHQQATGGSPDTLLEQITHGDHLRDACTTVVAFGVPDRGDDRKLPLVGTGRERRTFAARRRKLILGESVACGRMDRATLFATSSLRTARSLSAFVLRRVSSRPLVERAGDFTPADSHRALRAWVPARPGIDPRRGGDLFSIGRKDPRRPRRNPPGKFWRCDRHWGRDTKIGTPAFRSRRTRADGGGGTGTGQVVSSRKAWGNRPSLV